MKTFTSLIFSVIIAASLSLAQRTNAQECTVNVSGCPPTYLTACADTYQNSILGANVNYTPPSFSVSCFSNYAFVMSFDLPESLSGANCWTYNKVQRVGTGGGELRLFQSTGTGDPYFQSPAFFMLGSTNCDMTIFRSSGELFDCNVYLVNGSGTISSTPAATLHIDATHPNNTLKDYLFTVDPATVGWTNGVYNLLFKFTALNSVSNKNLVTLLQINAVLYGSGCSGDVNFAVTSTGAPGFYPVGSTPVTYSATYKDSSGAIVSSQQCLFNVVVNNVAISNISTTNTTCSGNNGSITFTATSANTSVNNMQYSLDGGTFTTLTGTASTTSTTTNTANGTTTTTSAVVTTTLSNLSASTHTLIVKDAVTNCASPSQSITISSTPDSQNPVVTCKVSTTQTVDANTGATYVKSGTDWDATATDNCGTPTLTYSLSGATTGSGGATLNGVTFNEGTTTVTWTATDGTGNHSSCSFDVVVNASADLSIVKTVESSQVVAGQELKYKIVVSNPTGPSYARNVVISDAVTAFASPMYSTDDVTYSPWTGSYNVPETIAKNASATIYIKGTLSVTQCSGVSNTATVTSDNDTNTANNSSTVASTVLDKTAPTANNPTPITGLKCKGDVPAPDITVVTDEADNCTSSPTVAWVKDENNGGAGCPDDPYIVTRTYSVTDASGNSINVTQTITVIDDVKPVVQTTTGSLDHTLQCSNATGITAALAEVPTATDNCTATPTIHLVSDVTTPDANCANAYVRVRTWNFTDGCGNTSENFVQTITVIDNTAPVVQTAAGSLDHTLQCSNTTGITAALAEAPTATDNGTANPTIHLVSDITTPDANCANAYVRVRTWNFTDGCGNTSENFVQTITVIDNTAPVVQTATGSLNHTLQCSEASAIAAALAQAPTATDNCTATPTIHLVSDVTTPDANCANAYVRVRTWNFTDGCGNTSENFVQTITVIDNTAPVVQTAAGSLDHTLQCSNTSGITAALAEAPTATDNGTANPTIHLVSDITTPDANCANAYVRVRTWNFTDGCGNTSENFVQTITVIDNTAPVVQTTAGSLNHTLQCSGASAIAAALAQAPTATDNCTATPTIHLVSDVTTPDANCANAYIRVRTWNFTDGCGNTSENFVQTITVIDNTAPVVQTTAGSLNHTLQCSDASAIAAALAQAPTASDNCTATPTIHLVSDVTTPDANCANAYIRVRTWNFTDGCGNTSENFVQTITVIDNTAPVVQTAAGSLNHTLQCSDASAIAAALAQAPTATDNCTATPTIHLVSDVTTPDANCANAYVRVRTWNFTDGCGNTSESFVQTITVIDNTAPVVQTATGSLNHTLQCSDASAIAAALAQAPTATDNCTITPTIHLVSDVTTSDQSCANAYVRVRTWNFTDGCGNTSENFVQTITVIDNTAPVVQTAAGSLNHTLQCSDASAIAAALAQVPTATDNCTATPTIHLVSDVTTPDANCANAYVRVRTWNFTDGCGNTSENFVQTITVIDNTAPVVQTTAGSLNHTLQCSDASAIAAALAQAPTATDNCTATPTIHLVSDVTTPDANCANAYVRVRTWNFTDGCGNTSENFVQTITVIDNTAPVVQTATGSLNHTLQCSDASAIAAALAQAPTATDNCTATPTIHLVSDVTTPDQSCANAYVRVRTWNFTDGCGNTSENFVQTITVIDNIAPVVQTTAGSLNHTLQCSDASAIAAALAQAPTATDNCTATPTIHLVSDVTTPDANCANAYVRVRTWNFTDGCGNTSESFVQTITVIDNTAPIWSTHSDALNRTLQCSDATGLATAQALAPTATDNCTTTLIPVKTSGAFVPGSCPQAGTYTNTWIVSDGCGNTSNIYTQIITITDTQAPTLTLPADITIYKDAQCHFDATPAVTGNPTNVTDNCDPNPVVSHADITGFTYNDVQGNVNHGNGYSFPFAIRGMDGLTAANIKSVMLDISTNQELSSLEFTLISPSGQGIILVGPYCATCNPGNTGSYKPTFYPASSGYPKWNNSNLITDRNGNYTPSDGTPFANPTPPELTAGYISKFEDFTGPMNGTWTLFGIKDGTSSGHGAFKSITLIPKLCEDSEIIIRSWSATDACGNVSSRYDQVVKVLDNTAPVWTSQSGSLDVTLECSDAAGLTTAQAMRPTASDNCDQTLFVQKTSGAFVPGTCPQMGTYTNTFTVADTCGNQVAAPFVQVITIKDTTAPVLSEAPANVTVECNAVPTAATLTASDNCDANPTVTFNEVRTDGNCPSNYILTRTWTATDACNNSSSKTQTITVQDTSAPVLSDAPANVTVESNAVPEAATLTATDNCDAAPVVTFQEVRTDGTCPNSYILTRTWTATDACGNSSSKTQTITIVDTTAPVLSEAPANVTVECNAVPEAAVLTATDYNSASVPVTFQEIRTDGNCPSNYILTRTWTATDACGNSSSKTQVITVQDTSAPVLSEAPANVTVECNAVPQPATLTALDNCDVNPTVTFNEVRTDGNCPSNYILTRTWTATDACGNSASKTQVINVQDTSAPILSEAPANVTVECNAVPEPVTLTALDNCDVNPTVAFNEVRTDGNCPSNYILTRTWTATDACGNSSSKTQVITVQDTSAPVLSEAPANVTVECNVVPEPATLTAIDNCDVNPTVTFNEVRTDGNCPSNYILTRTWTATDACGNSASKTQVITVQDTSAPVLSEAPANVTVECNAVPEPATLTATDNCDVNPTVTFNEVRTDGNCPSNYILTRTWTATDACGNSASKTQVITVQDTSAPVLSEAPANVTVECNAVPEPATLTASDNCDVNPTVTFNEVRTDGNCLSNYILTRTWTATDACGNSASKTQVITVQDTSAPVLSEAPANVTVECNAVPEPATLTATDNCDVNPTVTFNEVRTDGNCPSNYILTRTWTATDACGNSASKTQVITVQDTSAPVLSEAPANVTVECNAVPEPATLTATDNCDVNPTVTFNEVRTDGNCPSNYILTRTWTATDACGNSSLKTQVIKVADTTPPTLICPPSLTQFTDQDKGFATVTVGQPTVTDNCGNVTYSNNYTNTMNASGQYPIGTTTVTWTATDACGNVTTCVQTITVKDNQNPVFTKCWSGESVSFKTASGVHTYTIMGTDWDATAIDNDAIASLTYEMTGATSGSGSTLNNVSLNVGVTHIKWTAVDKSENVSICEYDITVIYGNVPPTAVDDIVTTPEDVTATGNVLTNDSDPDTGNILSVTGFVWNGTSYLPEASVTSQSGTLTLNANGTFSFAPALHYYGSVPAVTYSISDGAGGTASAQLLITVNHVNHSPIARPDAYTTPEGTPISGNVLTNDSDIDGDQVTVKSIAISEKQYTTPASVSISNTGNLAVNANGNFTFTPVASFYGDIPTVIYTATDGQASAAATLNIKVSPIPPIAVDDNASVIQNSSVTINVLANDNYGPAGSGTASLITTNAAHGTVTVDNGGTPTNQADDQIVYMPALGYTGSDSFTYTITGSNNLTATATVTISVRPYTDILMFNKRSTVPVDNGDGTVSWKYTLSITNKLPNDAITAIHITDDLSRVILSPMTFEVVGKTATGNLKVNGLFDGVSHTDLLLDGSSVAGNSKDSITIELRATLNGFYGYIYNQAVMDGSTSATGTISNVLSDDPSNTEASFPRPTRTFMPEILIIPDVITPNQDGHNDRFVIIHSYRLKISMEIFNRWGNKVYESNDYQNDWDGKGSGHLLGKDLPSGTYYYIIVTRNTETGKVQKYAHYLTLKR